MLLGCTPSQIPYVFLQYGKEFRQADVNKLLADNPLGPGENIKITTLGQGQSASHHIVQIRDRESPHLHKAHDGTVIVLRGRGYLMMDTRRITLTAGDIVHIPTRRSPLLRQYRSGAHGCIRRVRAALRRQGQLPGDHAIARLDHVQNVQAVQIVQSVCGGVNSIIQCGPAPRRTLCHRG